MLTTRAMTGRHHTRGSMSVHSLIDRFDQQSSGGVGTLAAAAAAAAAEESASESATASATAGDSTLDKDTNKDDEKDKATDIDTEMASTGMFKPKLQPLASEPLLLAVRSLASSPKHPDTPKYARGGSVASLLGPDLADISSYSESVLVEAIRLRIEQEKTQQEVYRRDVASKNLDILQTALRAQVPLHLIPQMCVSSSLIAEQTQLQQLQAMYVSQQQLQLQLQVQLQLVQQTTPYGGHQPQRLLFSQSSGLMQMLGQPQQPPQQQPQLQHPFQPGQPLQQSGGSGVFAQHQPLGSIGQSYSGTQFVSPLTLQPITGATGSIQGSGLLPSGHYSGGERNARGYPVASLARPDTLSASSVPPLNYRFGGPSVPSTSTLSSPSYPSTRRPLSPAKIGAQAVATLNMPTTPSKRPATSLYLHQRHYSMPVDSSSTSSELPMTHSSLIQSVTSTPQRGTKSGTKRSSQGPPSPSLSGTTARIQVNPLPAQPLHKQKKLGAPPSQESMTSLSHIIQFHHWKPENPGAPMPQGQSQSQSLSTPSRGHKRHKLESMSIDAGSSQAPSKLTTPDENTSDHDLTLDDDTDTSRLAEPPTQPQGQ